MSNKSDKLIHIKLYSPHKTDYIWEREDGSRYVHRKLDEESMNELSQNPSNPNEWLIGEKIKFKK